MRQGQQPQQQRQSAADGRSVRASGPRHDQMTVTVPHAPAATGLVEPEAEPDMRGQQAIASMAALLESVAAELEGKQQLQKCLSVRLLALQLLLVAINRDAGSHVDAAVWGSNRTTVMLQQEQQQLQQGGDSRQRQESGLLEPHMSSKQMRQMLLDIAHKTEEGVEALREDGEGMLVPFAWQVVYEAALDLAKTGAVQEVIGELQACIPPYSQVRYSQT